MCIFEKQDTKEVNDLFGKSSRLSEEIYAHVTTEDDPLVVERKDVLLLKTLQNICLTHRGNIRQPIADNGQQRVTIQMRMKLA